MNKKIFLLVLIGIIAASMPLTIFLMQRQQQIRSKANASTSLSFSPASTTSTPIQKTIGDTFSINIMIDPGANLVTFVKFQIKYDPTKLSLITTFIPNTTAFPNTIEGPIITGGTLAASVSIGSDPGKAIKTITKVGTLNFKAIDTTGSTPTQITYTAITEALSAGSSDQASENILSTTTPANIIINTNLPPTSTPIPTSAPTPKPTTTPIPTLTATPNPTPANTYLDITVYQHGIWNSGDNTNPNNTSLSNKKPVHTTINADLELFNTSNQLAGQGNGTLTYNAANGNYQGSIEISPNTLTSDKYYLKIKTGYHLKRLVPGILTITAGQKNIIPDATLVTGDANNDNKLNILDYNLLLNCYSDLTAAIACDPDKKVATDFNDNTLVNQVDYNLFLREIATQPGE